MTSVEMRPRIDDLGPHDHASWAFDPAGDQDDSLAAYLMAGIERRERVEFHGAPAGRAATVADRLSARGAPVADLVASGRLGFGSAVDLHLGGGDFDPDRQLHGYAAAVQAAVRDGFRGLRIASDVGWLADHPAVLPRWPAFELRADLLAAQLPITALCVYDATRAGAADLALIESVHALRVRQTGHPVGVQAHAQRDGSIRVRGELDLSFADRLRGALVAAAAEAPAPVIDVAGLTFIDVAGMRTILAAGLAMAAAKGAATIRGAGPAFRRIWYLAGFDTISPAVRVE